LQGYLRSRRAKGKGVAADAEGGARGGCYWNGEQVAATLTRKGCDDRMPDKERMFAVLQPTAYRWQNDRDGLQQDDAVAALRASQGASGFHEMNHPVIAQPVPYDLFQITAPVNRQNRVPGDPCHTLAKDNAAHAAIAIGTDCYNGAITGDVAATMGTPGSSVNASGPTVMQTMAFDWQSGGDSRGPDPKNTAQLLRCQTPAVAHVETLPQQGYDAFHASTQETNAVATLRTLRNQIGEEAFAAWGLGILDSLQPQEVLRARLHGLGIRCATFSRSWPIDCAISRKEDRATWAMQSVREAQGEGCPSLGWQLPQQLATELGAYLSELPRPGAQTERFVRDLWLAGEGIGFLREALSAFQEARRPAHREGQPALHAMQVRRLTATECEFLQGFPRNWTLIPWRKKPAEDCPDGPRYKALGNSMACNCMAWIGERIAAYESQTPNQKEHT
jgi:hypothetical protein